MSQNAPEESIVDPIGLGRALSHRAWLCARLLNALWIQIGLTLLFIMTADLLANTYLYFFEKPPSDPRVAADAYHGARWPREYFREYDSRRARWEPYSYWLMAPFKGRYINIDANGFRATWQSRATSGCEHRTRIFMFGGSAMWGDGERDDYTIPSWLQRLFDSGNYCAEVVNMGQDAYVSTQEMLLLRAQIRRGNVPDIAVFYDGYNDVIAAAWEGSPGITFNEESRRKAFTIVNNFDEYSVWRLDEEAVFRTALTSGLGRFAAKIVPTFNSRLFGIVRGQLVRNTTEPIEDPAAFEREIAGNYAANIASIEGLAREYGFVPVWYMQPVVDDKEPLTPYESRFATTGSSAVPHADMLRPGREMMVSAARGRVHDLRMVFRDSPQPYFIDDVHISEEGNRIIAEHMFKDFAAQVRLRR